MKNEYEVRGEVTAIFLKRKDIPVIETIIDTSDLDIAKRLNSSWIPRFDKTTNSYYVTGIMSGNGKKKTVLLHRWIMDTPENMTVDHIFHDTLMNRRFNLRNVTNAQNKQNIKGPLKNNKSGYRGVYWSKQKKKWAAQIRVNGDAKFLGYFECLDEAAAVALDARKKFMPYSVG